MLDIGIYNALLCRVTSGAFTTESIARAAGVDHPCVDFIATAPFPFYAINNYACEELPCLTQNGRVVLPQHFPVTFYNTREMTKSLRADEEVITIGVVHLRIRPAIYDPWVVFSMDNGRQGEFSLNSLMRRFKEWGTTPPSCDMMAKNSGHHDKDSLL